jgi:hypothetical protein
VRPSFTACASCSSRMRSSGIRCVIVSAVVYKPFSVTCCEIGCANRPCACTFSAQCPPAPPHPFS